ncbi:hypothetical protein D3C87_1422570 [compost metagenome]
MGQQEVFGPVAMLEDEASVPVVLAGTHLVPVQHGPDLLPALGVGEAFHQIGPAVLACGLIVPEQGR